MPEKQLLLHGSLERLVDSAAPEALMADQQFEFVDESEEPHLRGTPSPGRLTGWETVIFFVAEPDDDDTVTPGGAE